MRVKGVRVGSLHGDEEGTVLAIVAITLLVLIGMLVLTFDLGRS